jgi:hypothetical protein
MYLQGNANTSQVTCSTSLLAVKLSIILVHNTQSLYSGDDHFDFIFNRQKSLIYRPAVGGRD